MKTKHIVFFIILWIGTLGFWYADHREFVEEKRMQRYRDYTEFTKFEDDWHAERAKKLYPTLTDDDLEHMAIALDKADFEAAILIRDKYKPKVESK